MKKNSGRRKPAGQSQEAELYLQKISDDLNRLLINLQKKFSYETLRLSRGEIKNLALSLVEFGADIHYDMGLWRSLEGYNQAFFGTPLPLVLPVEANPDQDTLYERRVQFLLWNLYSEIDSEWVLSPTHRDLEWVAKRVAVFLQERFAKAPTESSRKAFLAQPNTFGWDVKRKLVWLGQGSYLFRYHFQNYVVNQHDGRVDIPVIDDFVCQATTTWSGLGVIDILAALLDISEAERAELRSWYERHAAYYKVLALSPNDMRVVNLINDAPYHVVIENPAEFFKVDEVLFGSLTPWRGEWYWSGGQSNYGPLPDKTIAEIKQDFLQKASLIAYRYCEARAAQARTIVEKHYQEFIGRHGDDLVIYPDGRSMKADLQKKHQLHNEALLAEMKEKKGKSSNLPPTAPEIALPPQLIDSKNGIGVYFYRAEGQEMMVEFYDVISGLEKRGDNLTDDEADALRGFIYSEEISPAFVERVIRDYGSESIAEAFLIRDYESQPYLHYLLRRYKGHFYRKRYPAVTIV